MCRWGWAGQAGRLRRQGQAVKHAYKIKGMGLRVGEVDLELSEFELLAHRLPKTKVETTR